MTAAPTVPLSAAGRDQSKTKGRSVMARTPAKSPPPIGVEEVSLERIGGAKSPAFNLKMAREVIPTMFSGLSKEDTPEKECEAVFAALEAFQPKDAIEGMLAAQAVAMHFASMECLRRAMIPGQPSDIAGKLRKDGANMARGMTDMLAALDRKRGNGVQVVRVERVVVHEGGQAIVGNITAPRMGGGA